MADIRKKSDAAWLVRWREDGKQRYRQFRTEAEAVEFKKDREADAFARKIFANPVPFPGISDVGPAEATEDRWSVSGYARRMVEGDAALTPGTRATYVRAIKRYLTDTPLGRADVRDVTSETVRDWWAGLRSGHADAQRLISKVFKRAILVGDREDDPLRRAPEVRKPRRKKDIDFDPLTYGQIETLADATLKATKGLQRSHERDRLMIYVMGVCGLRAGEAGGLRRQDLIDGCQLRVRQQVVRDVALEPPHLAPLKTRSSRRTITIPCWLHEELIAFADRYGTTEDGRLFYGPNGEMRDHTLTNNMVKRAAARAGMTGVHSHLLRHSAVSLLIHAGHNPREIQEYVGHADVSMTLGVYGHLFDRSGADIAKTWERYREEHQNGL
jgi:integrase